MSVLFIVSSKKRNGGKLWKIFRNILLTGEGPRDFLGSEILAKRDFLGPMEDTGIFGATKINQLGFFWVQLLYFSSAQINKNISMCNLLHWCVIFLGRQVLKLGSFGYKR